MSIFIKNSTWMPSSTIYYSMAVNQHPDLIFLCAKWLGFHWCVLFFRIKWNDWKLTLFMDIDQVIVFFMYRQWTTRDFASSWPQRSWTHRMNIGYNKINTLSVGWSLSHPLHIYQTIHSLYEMAIIDWQLSVLTLIGCIVMTMIGIC